MLTSISSYIDFDLDQVPEGDGTAFHILDVISHRGSIETLNQELRLSNSGRARTRWVIGANVDDIGAEERFINDFSQSSTPGALGIIGGGVYGKQDIRNYAAFANLEYDVTPVVAVKAGARYTDSELRSRNCGFDAGDGASNAFFTFLSGLLSGQAVPALQPGDCFNMDENFRNGPAFNDSLQEHNTSWRAGVDYQPNDALLIYANVAKGYKGGSFPVLGAATNAQYTPVIQESVLAYEAGVKASVTRWLHGNATLFHYDYEDKQLKSKSIDPVFGALDVLVNVPKTRLSGIELELMAAPLDGLAIQAALAYIDAEITDYVGINNAGVARDFSGAQVPYTPELTARLNADYEWPVRQGLLAFVGASVTSKSDTVAIVGGEDVVIDGRRDLYRLGSYTLLDLRAGIASLDDRWRLTFFGRNVGDEFYTINASTDSDAIVRYVGRPATWGITLSYKN
jgi:iron complex outermembrane receptor protein